MKTRTQSLSFSLILALLFLGGALALLSAGWGGPPPVLAQGPDGYATYYVAPDCSGLSVTPCYTTVQTAVDALDDPADEVWIATGTFTGVNAYGGLNQMVYVSKSLALRGGYSTTFALQDPDLYTTTLNAQDNGRVLYVTGAGITVTVEGLQITQGYTDGNGAGVYVAQATATISDCLINDNGYNGWVVISDEGGGLYISDATVRLENNVISHNWADNGGGVAVRNNADVTIIRNDVNENDAYETGTAGTGGDGGGVYVYGSPGATLIGNQIHHNQAQHSRFSDGGGVMIKSSDGVVLQDNEIYHNSTDLNVDYTTWTDSGGAGLKIDSSNHVQVTNNQVYSNTAETTGNNVAATGAGVNIVSSNYVSFAHNSIHHNQAVRSGNGESGQCGGLYTYDVDDSTFAHNEIYDNTSTDRWGGVVLRGDNITFEDNDVYNNAAQNGAGGGIAFEADATNTTLRNNRVHHNTAATSSGGVSINGEQNRLEGNEIYANSATTANGGIGVGGDNQTLIANRVYSNTAGYGGGVNASAPGSTFINNVIADNTATDGRGGGLVITDPGISFWHTTFARNHGDTAVYAFSTHTAVFTHTVFYSQTVGVYASGAVTMTLTLWDNVMTQTVGVVNTLGNITGTAAFAPDGYHLTAASDALDAGMDTSINDDIDGEPRPMGDAPDLGADEYPVSVDLALLKTGPISGTAGQVLTYTLVITNAAGSGLSADARVVDAVEPASAVATLSASTPGGDCTASDAAVVCILYNVATDTQRAITVWVTPTATYDGVLTDNATVTPTNAIDTNGMDNSDAVTTSIVYVVPVPDLWVSKGVSALYAEPGDTLVYTVTWGNSGDGTVYSTTLTDTLPTGVNFVAATPSPGSADPLVWDLGNVAPGVSETYIITATVNSGLPDGTVLTNTALIAAPGLSDTAAATTTVYEQAAGMYAVKTAGLGEASPGDLLEYTIVISNTGPVPINPTLGDPRPEGTELQLGWTASRGTLDYDHGLEAFNWSDSQPLKPGESVEMHFGFKVVSCEGYQCGMVRNIASISEATYPYLDRDLQADTIIQCPDMSVAVDADETVTFMERYNDLGQYQATVAYENTDHGTQSITATARLTLTLPEPPAGAWFEQANPAPTEQISGHQWVWAFDDLAPGDGGTIGVTIGPEYWLDEGYTLGAEIKALPRDADHPALECVAHQADNHAKDTTYPAGLTLKKKTSKNRWMVYVDPYNPEQVHHQYQLEYYVTYGYRSAVPARPPVTTFGLVDHFPAELTLDKHLSQPGLNHDALPDHTYMWESPTPVQVDDSGWLRILGVTDRITVGQRLTNTIHGSAAGNVFTFEKEDQVASTVPLFPPVITHPGNGEACPGEIEIRGVAPIGSKVTIFRGEVGDAVPDGEATVDAQGRFTATVDLPDSYEAMPFWARASTGEILGDDYKESEPSNVVKITTPPQGGHWCPQRSYWEGTVKAGSLKGQEMSFQFRDANGNFSTQDWQMPGVHGFWDTLLHLKTCCEAATQVYTVTADGVDYVRSGPGTDGYHIFAIGQAHTVQIKTQCGAEKKTGDGDILIDPDGFVFDVDKGGGYDGTTGMFNPVQAISSITVTCMMSAPQWGGWVPWPAHLYEDQVNPQVTDDVYPDGITTTGYYAFFTPPGLYYLQVEGIPGYQEWRSPVVEVITQIVHVNVPYTPWISDTEVYSVSVLPAQLGPGTLWNGVLLGPAVITMPVGSAIEWTSALSDTNTVDDLIRWSETPIFQVLSERDPLLDTTGFDSGYLEPGRAYRRAFARPGVYTYTVYGRSGRVVVIGDLPKLYLPSVLKNW
jgi:uncharacterized repeat protein (TIGR01451 family)